MFARTPRLLLRPGFPEDAPALAAAIADEQIVRHLATAPWPYRMRDATAFLAAPRDPVLPSLLIFERTQNAPTLAGACGLGRRPSGAIELGYWIARSHWGRIFPAVSVIPAVISSLPSPARDGSSSPARRATSGPGRWPDRSTPASPRSVSVALCTAKAQARLVIR